MANYGQGSAKRHVAWSNDCEFIDGIVRNGGYLSVADRQALCLNKLAHHYYDPKVGKIRYTGKSLLLPESSCPICLVRQYVVVSCLFHKLNYIKALKYCSSISDIRFLGSTPPSSERRLLSFSGSVVTKQLSLPKQQS